MTYIQKCQQENQFTQIPNETCRDTTISLQAHSLLIFMLSLPDSWKIQPAWLAKEKGVGKNTIYKYLKELQEAKYLVRRQERNEQGKFSNFVYTLYYKSIADSPQTLENKGPEPLPKKRGAVKRDAENRGLINKEEKKEIVSKKVSNAREEQKNSFEEEKVINLMNIDSVVRKNYFEKVRNAGLDEITYIEALEDFVDWCADHGKKCRVSGFLRYLEKGELYHETAEKLRSNNEAIAESKKRASDARRTFLEEIYDDKAQEMAYKTIDNRKKRDSIFKSEEELSEENERFKELSPEKQKILRKLRGF